MSANRCGECGFAHLPGDPARCETARALGLKLNARLLMSAIPPACEQSYHERIKADAATFLLQTENHRDWVDDQDRLLIGECVKCHSTVAFYVGSAVALQAMRAGGGR